MKSIYFLLFLYLQIIYSIAVGLQIEDKETNSSFCKYCKCNETTKDVLCDIAFNENVYNKTAYWMDQSTNKSYGFTRVSIHNSNIFMVTKIPTSPLKVLDLSYNRLQQLEEGAFQNLQDMEELILSNNELTSPHFGPDVFMGQYQAGSFLPLRSLKVLRLDGNTLHTIHQDLFEHISKLEILDLHGNPLKYLDGQTNIAISSLLYLQNLDLSYTQIKSLPAHILHPLRNLKVLNLTGNELREVPRALEDGHGLEWLSLSQNLIVNVTEESGFPKMENLLILKMDDMLELRYIGDHSMCGLEKLLDLYMSDNNKLTYFSAKALSAKGEDTDSASWPNVEKLILRNNKLSYLERELLASWDSMKEIDIRDNPWACDCENQWMIDELIPYIGKLNIQHTLNIDCAFPIEMEGRTFRELSKLNYTMRCLDLFGNRPERDANIVVGLLIGVFLTVLIILSIIYCYKRNWFGYLEKGPATFSRKFYNRTGVEEDGLY